MSLLLLLQTPTPTPVVLTTPERMPALITLIYVSGFFLIILALFSSLLRSWLKSSDGSPVVPADLPKAVKQRLASGAQARGTVAD